MASVNTNYGALLALQNLTKTQTDLGTVQNQINTGLKVASAKDNGAVFAIAQQARGKVAGYNVATDTVDKAISTLDVAISAGNAISDLLTQLKTQATAATDPSLTTSQLADYNANFTRIRDEITNIVSNANFNGANLISATGTNVTAFADDTGTTYVTVTATSLALSGTINTITTTDTVDTLTNAQNSLTHVNATITALNQQLASFGAASQALSTHKTFLTSLTDTLTAGIGNLVDADLAKASATLQSLQVKQQLGAQALSIANQAPQILLKFFQ
jgi:flagellin